MVGLDLGPSAIAVVADQVAVLQPFCPEVAPDAKALRRLVRRLDRKLDRQRRANNPGNYDERGRVKKGRKRWTVSKRQRKVQARRREVYRKLVATRKRSHGHLAHRVLALGSAFHLEHLSYRSWQRTYGKSVQLCAPGMFVERLSHLVVSAGGTIVDINPGEHGYRKRATAAGSSRNLGRSAGICVPAGPAPSGISSPPSGTLCSSRNLPARRGPGATSLTSGEPSLQAAYEQAIQNQPASGRKLPAAFGQPPGLAPSQSGSLAKRSPSRT